MNFNHDHGDDGPAWYHRLLFVLIILFLVAMVMALLFTRRREEPRGEIRHPTKVAVSFSSTSFLKGEASCSHESRSFRFFVKNATLKV
ncbi:MAG: hypothetical protein HY420_04390 [Candidatus Kerfeldbacteria bacterium]|nr:hypothetical protein [Candidatus Kerfeldbacteria bacterium]